jgi:sulfite dehydrogenase (quinone) subunit SoeA
MKMLTDKDPDTGEYKIPKIIYSDAYASEMVSFADLVLPDTTYLERWDCISMLDRPISSAHAAADSIRQPVVEPDRDVRPFQDVVLDLGHRLGLPGMTLEDGGARYPAGYSDYLVHHERKPGIGSLAGWRNEDGSGQGKGAPNPDQLQRYIENGCFWEYHLDPDQLYFKHANRSYLDLAQHLGFIDSADPIVMQLYSEELQRFRLAAEGHGDHQPPADKRERVEKYFDPLPIWYPPFEDDQVDVDDYPLHALTQRPAAMYHSWGSQNAWLRQLHTANRLYIPRKLAAAHDIKDDDWVWLESRNGKIKGQVRLMDGVNENTVWTWNAIGKRKGAWALADDAPESREGFLLNHLIDDLLPERESGYRYANADPVTGQAAWYDLRVKISKASPAEQGVSSPQFDAQRSPPGIATPPDVLKYGGDL